MKQIDLHLGKICANRTSSIRANKQEMCEFDQKFQRNVISPSICQTLMWNVVGKCQHGISFWTWKNTPLKLMYFGIFSLCGRFLLCVTKYKIFFSFTITFLKTFSLILSETFWQIWVLLLRFLCKGQKILLTPFLCKKMGWWMVKVESIPVNKCIALKRMMKVGQFGWSIPSLGPYTGVGQCNAIKIMIKLEV